MEVNVTKTAYLSKQILFIINQIAVIAFLGFMAAQEHYIENNQLAQFFLLSLIFFDAAYISYRNIKNSNVLNYFSLLLFLIGWQFLLYLYDYVPICKEVSIVLLPICFYRSLYFIQTFFFQDSAYRGKSLFLGILKITCLVTVICYGLSEKAFFIAYQLQFIASVLMIVVICSIHHKRVVFVLKSYQKQFFLSFILVLLPFSCYVFAFHNHAAYMAGMGSYIAAMLTFISIHSIVFQYHPRQEQYAALPIGNITILFILGFTGLSAIAVLFQIHPMAILILVHITALLILIYNVLLYLRISKQPADYNNLTDRRHFYEYSLAQIKREESLKKEFADYLHDDILQDLLSIKNMIRKADQPEIQRILLDTLGELNSSIRLQMQTYHPSLLKSLTLKENIQNLIDILGEHSEAVIKLECDNDIFLVEPYNVIIYRIIKELVMNGLKHAEATEICVVLIQENERIFLKVSDNGIGFKVHSYQQPFHRGLSSIQEQVSLLNGTMSIQTTHGGGTELTITMPMNGGDSYESFVDR